MITKPSLFDIKYDNMDQNETLLNYERDMMLWEQTEALNRLTNNNNNPSGISSKCTPYYTPINKFNINAPEYNDYERISAKYNSLMDREFYLSNNTMSSFVFIVVIIIVTLPVCICTNQELAKILGFIALPISLIPIILLKLLINRVRIKIKNVVSQLEDLDKRADIMNTPKKFNKKIIKKQKPVREVFYLEH